jgi:hypothetical protein
VKHGERDNPGRFIGVAEAHMAHVVSSWRRTVAGAATLLTVYGLSTSHLGYQSCTPATCQDQAFNIADPTLDVMLLSVQPCKFSGTDTDEGLEDGANVRAAQDNISHGARSSVVGQYCVPRGCASGSCINLTPQNRNLTNLNLRILPPGGGYVNFLLKNLNTPPYLQLIDTDSGLTNGPRIWDANTEGEYVFNTNAVTTGTSCNIQPTTHPITAKSVNVMVCQPSWLYHEGTFYRGPLENVKLNVPLGMDEALIPAGNAAATVAAAMGVSVDVTYNQPCSGGACMNLTEDPAVGEDCAAFIAAASPTGVHTAPSNIAFQPPTSSTNWRTTHPTRLQQLIAHELMHYFGLGNRGHATCSHANTLMKGGWEPSCYSSAAPPTGSAVGPTWSDSASARTGSYGPQNQKYCGW